jgi:magnesium transporter
MITYYKNGHGQEEIPQWESGCWIHISKPADEDLHFLANELKVPEDFYSDVADIDERPRIDEEDGWRLCVLRLPVKIEDDSLPFSTVPMGIIFKKDILLTICFFDNEVVSDFVYYSRRKNVLIESNLDLVMKLNLSSSVWFLKYLKRINLQIKLAEKELEKSIKNEDLQTLLQLEKCLVFFTTSLKGNDILLHRIRNVKSLQNKLDLELLEDVQIELRQALETTNIYSDILSGMMDAYASVISNNLNIIMKQLTSISIILMIPTLIASLYGMNVPNALEEYKYGFWIILFFSFLLSVVSVLLFKRKKWF